MGGNKQTRGSSHCSALEAAQCATLQTNTAKHFFKDMQINGKIFMVRLKQILKLTYFPKTLANVNMLHIIGC